jgi:predicted NAD/FAD-dependent oxidoreductase
MATRRLEKDGARALFDHGAQFFTARSPEFKQEVERWSEQNLAREWFRGQSTLLEDGTIESKPDGHPRFCCPQGMTAITKYLGATLDIQTGVRITKLEHEGGWILHGENGEIGRAKYLVMTPPVPQSLDLLDASQIGLPHEERQVLEAMRYERCIAVMLWLSGEVRVPNGALYARTSKLSWLGDNQSKGLCEVPALTLHGTPEWSVENWEASDADVVAELATAARDFWSGEIMASSVARWKFSKPIEPREDGCHVIGEKNLIFAGDAFGGAKVEGAWTSGRSAAREVLGMKFY